ncbi:ABC transporter permease [Anaerobaca lacustris]|uniref:ABC transporter permease n=1 Tax=Anaerobaca lacustris TaxID=3044600 RepID=A0AAW6U087_9BACT|nr:ABC transporter permease [Sedimentisphaerales bacterium M17dextr]
MHRSDNVTALAPTGRLKDAFLRRVLLSDSFVLFLAVVYFLVLWAFLPRLGSARNLSNLSSNIWPLFVLVIGQMFVLIVGGIDLSQTSIMAITSVCGALLMTSGLDPALFARNPLWGVLVSEQGGPLAGSIAAVPVGILVMLAIGALIGLANGLAVAKCRMPPFMVTLVSMFFFSGLAILITRSENVTNLPVAFLAIGQNYLGHVQAGRSTVGLVPYSFFAGVALAWAAWFILGRTIAGRWFYAVGMNRRAATASGIPTDRVIVCAYVISGFCAALGSVLYSSRLGAGRPTLGANVLLDIVGAAVIGGISLYGGKGKVRWAFYGVLFFVVLDSSLYMLNLRFYTVNIVKGAVILVAALLDVLRNRVRMGRTPTGPRVVV